MSHLLSLLGLVLTVAVCLFGALGSITLAQRFTSWVAQDFYFGLAALFLLLSAGFIVLFVKAGR